MVDRLGMGGGEGARVVVVNLDRVKKCTHKHLKKLGNNQSNPIKYKAWVPLSHPAGTILASVQTPEGRRK